MGGRAGMSKGPGRSAEAALRAAAVETQVTTELGL